MESGCAGMASDMVASGPTVRIVVFDKDMTTSDDVLGQVDVQLAGGAALNVPTERTVTLSDPSGKYRDFDLSFSWVLSDVVPPPSTLSITRVKANGVGKKGMQDPYIMFKLLECGDLLQMARLSTKVNETDPDWGDETITLSLPHGQSRPPLIKVFLWDEDCLDDDDGLATTDCRLPDGASGTVKLELVGVGKGNKNVDIAFEFRLTEDI